QGFSPRFFDAKGHQGEALNGSGQSLRAIRAGSFCRGGHVIRRRHLSLGGTLLPSPTFHARGGSPRGLDPRPSASSMACHQSSRHWPDGQDPPAMARRPYRYAGSAKWVILVAMQPGEVIGERFEIERRVGSGGMGVVYRARDLASGEAVAVKVLR